MLLFLCKNLWKATQPLVIQNLHVAYIWESFVRRIKMKADKDNLIIIYSQTKSLSLLNLFKSVFVTCTGKKAVVVWLFHWEELPWIGICIKIWSYVDFYLIFSVVVVLWIPSKSKEKNSILAIGLQFKVT